MTDRGPEVLAEIDKSIKNARRFEAEAERRKARFMGETATYYRGRAEGLLIARAIAQDILEED